MQFSPAGGGLLRLMLDENFLYRPFTIIEPPEFMDQVASFFGAARFQVWDEWRNQIDLVAANAGHAIMGAMTVQPGLQIKFDCDPDNRRITYRQLI